jgi:hypothetical protein
LAGLDFGVGADDADGCAPGFSCVAEGWVVVMMIVRVRASLAPEANLRGISTLSNYILKTHFEFFIKCYGNRAFDLTIN